jgi:hypothetical protein
MNIKEFKLLKGEPVQDLMAFIWINQDQSGELNVPYQYFEHKDLEKGKACIGKIIAVGPKVKSFNINDLIYFNEYEADTGQFLKNNEVYFVEEKFIEIKIIKPPKQLIYRL